MFLLLFKDDYFIAFEKLTVSRDNFGLGQLWIGPTLVRPTLGWAYFGSGNFGPDNNGWDNFDM